MLLLEIFGKISQIFRLTLIQIFVTFDKFCISMYVPIYEINSNAFSVNDIMLKIDILCKINVFVS